MTIIIFCRTVAWFLLKNIIWTVGIVVGVRADIARMNTKMSRPKNRKSQRKKSQTQMSKNRNNPDTYQLIYDIVKCIPVGRVTTYGAIAQCIGVKSGARMVGYALNNCHHSAEKIPAHRVVNRLGLLTGRHHFENDNTMEKLLSEEGVAVEAHKVVEFEKLFWDPFKEL